MDYLKITPYGPTDDLENLDYILLDQHGDNGSTLLLNHPEIRQCIYDYDDQEVFSDYLRIEQDIGATELTKAIAEELKTVRGAIVRVLLPRGIIDMNRKGKNAIRNIFDLNKYGKFGAVSNMIEGVKWIYEETSEEIDDILGKLSPSGVLVDIHTMSPYDVPVIKESPETLKEYISTYGHTPESHERDVCLITEQEDGEIIADLDLYRSFITRLITGNIPHRKNQPYNLAPHTAAKDRALKIPAMFIDVPKDLVTKEQSYDSDYNPANLTVDMHKVVALAKIFASAVSKSLNDNPNAPIPLTSAFLSKILKISEGYPGLFPVDAITRQGERCKINHNGKNGVIYLKTDRKPQKIDPKSPETYKGISIPRKTWNWINERRLDQIIQSIELGHKDAITVGG